MTFIYSASNPYPQILNLQGTGLNDGDVYFGVAGQDPVTNPITVYWDAGGTIPAAQPIPTSGGYLYRSGTPANVYINNQPYSIKVLDKNGAQVYYQDEVLDPVFQFITELSGPTGSELVGWKEDAASAENQTVAQWSHYQPDMNVFSFLTDAEIASVKAYTFSTDVAAKVQAALDEAFAAKRNLYAPAGGYYVPGGLTLPGESSKRAWSFRFYGDGPGELFAVVQNPNGSTIFKNDTNAPTLQYVQDVPNTGNGFSEIDNLVFFGNSTTPVVKLGALYSQSEFHHNGIYQAGNGDGLEVAQSNTSAIHHNYVINKDWNTGSLGSSRVGTGIYVHQPLSTGLTDVHSNTCRGFKDGLIFGDGSGNVLYSLRVSHNECSLTYNGITLTTSVSVAWVNNNYLEGIDGGVGILNEGRYNSIVSNLIFFGCSTAIKDTGALSIGTNIIGNLVAAGSRANTVLIDVASDAAYGGPVKIVRGNTLTFSGSGGSIAGVVGIQISGNTPRIYFDGNAFDPRGQWTGGAGTTAINDLSTASLAGVAQHGLTGFGIVKNGNQEFPKMSQGALGLGVPENALGDSAFSAGVLTTGLGSYFVLTLTAAQNITSIATVGGKTNQGDIIIIRATNANPTFKQGNNIKLSGSADFTPGANGAMIGFISAGTFGGIPIIYELFRTSY